MHHVVLGSCRGRKNEVQYVQKYWSDGTVREYLQYIHYDTKGLLSVLPFRALGGKTNERLV